MTVPVSLTKVSVSHAKVTGIVAALACLAFSAIGLKVNDPPAFAYVDGVRDRRCRSRVPS